MHPEESIGPRSPMPPPAAVLRSEAFAPDLGNAERGLSEPDAREIADKRHAWSLWSAVEDLYSARRGRAIMDSNTGTYSIFGTGFGTGTEQDGVYSGDLYRLGRERIYAGRENHEKFPRGWPKLAAFINSADDLTMFRRFGRAHCRILLHLEAEITILERKLDLLDTHDAESPDFRYRLMSSKWREGWDPAQKNLLNELKTKLFEYDKLLTKDNKLRALDRPPAHNFLAVFNWVWSTKPLDRGHYDSFKHRADMVYTSDHSRRKDRVDHFIQYCSRIWAGSRFMHYIRNRKKRNEDILSNNEDENTSKDIFSALRIPRLAKFVFAILIPVTMLLAPVLLLSLISMQRKLATTVVIVFVLAFAVLMSALAGAKVEVIFLSTCAYCAVLVTFLGNIQDNGAGVGII
ncbi:hypothetical protein L207DRAFT_565827 [Hyaloscypha variabilis F]|uniref:DUF6594 domain-containing protein n=1 Tax=Hyaloscypha variabilis (strain UAMH 11265 / GT02V1 / F) TaxID=1149755 RepID=A0A2J6RPA2_HYAVF|nr:hypothetical protein L207DRAFT_565827 [Hyaloscypha variabilis F]